MKKIYLFLLIAFLFSPVIATWACGLTAPAGSVDITSFFDHDSPDYTDDSYFVRYDGKIWDDGSASLGSCTDGLNCYDGHNGVDFNGDANDDILAAASGTVSEIYWNSCG